jgi:uncharacterized membrane protein YhaH (DUF805 family)
MIWYLFSFEGRINRAKYWLAGLVICGLMLFLIMLLFVPISYLFGGSQKLSINFNLTNIFAVFDPQSYRGWSRSELGSIAVHAIVMPPVLWMFLATAVKRLHDRDRSGWWLVVFFALPWPVRTIRGPPPRQLLGPLGHLADPRMLSLGCRRALFPPGHALDQPVRAEPARQAADAAAQPDDEVARDDRLGPAGRDRADATSR